MQYIFTSVAKELETDFYMPLFLFISLLVEQDFIYGVMSCWGLRSTKSISTKFFTRKNVLVLVTLNAVTELAKEEWWRKKTTHF